MNIGTIKMAGRAAAAIAFGAETWLLCDGQLVAVAAWPDLFALIGYTYGGVGAVFATPNYGAAIGTLGRIPVGVSGAGYLLANTPGADNHDHLFGFGAPPMAHVPARIGTLGASTTVGITGGGFGLVADGPHQHLSDPLDPHPIAAQPIGADNTLSPCLAVGFYIRAF